MTIFCVRGRSRFRVALSEVFTIDRLFSALAFLEVFRARRLAAAKANPIFGRSLLGFGPLALFAVFVQVDNHHLRGGFQNSRASLPATRNMQAVWSRD